MLNILRPDRIQVQASHSYQSVSVWPSQGETPPHVCRWFCRLISFPGLISYTEYLFLLTILTSKSLVRTVEDHISSIVPNGFACGLVIWDLCCCCRAAHGISHSFQNAWCWRQRASGQKGVSHGETINQNASLSMRGQDNCDAVSSYVFICI